VNKRLSVIGITSFIFLLIGTIYIYSGLLVSNFLKSEEYYTNFGPEIVFLLLGLIFFFVGMILLVKEIREHIIYNNIITNGDYIKVKVTKVKHVTSVKVNRRSPYVIYATHSDLPTNKEMKSFYLWKIPYVAEGDRIRVLAHPSYPYNFVLEEDSNIQY